MTPDEHMASAEIEAGWELDVADVYGYDGGGVLPARPRTLEVCAGCGGFIRKGDTVHAVQRRPEPGIYGRANVYPAHPACAANLTTHRVVQQYTF